MQCNTHQLSKLQCHSELIVIRASVSIPITVTHLAGYWFLSSGYWLSPRSVCAHVDTYGSLIERETPARWFSL